MIKGTGSVSIESPLWKPFRKEIICIQQGKLTTSSAATCSIPRPQSLTSRIASSIARCRKKKGEIDRLYLREIVLRKVSQCRVLIGKPSTDGL